MSTPLYRTFAGISILTVAGAAHTAPVVYFGENTAACTTPGVRATCSVSGNPLTARNNFQSQLVGVGTQNFESYANGTGLNAALPIAFAGSSGNITATIGANTSGFVSDGTGFGGFGDTEGFGRWNTSPGGGSNWYLSFNPFVIDFDVAISAFGFYGTDVGDASGSLTITLTDENGNTSLRTVNHTPGAPNGSLLFWGFVDTSVRYTRVAFGNSSGGFDGFGFDGMTIGDRQQVAVPEPGTLALVGLSLAALAALGYRRRA